MEREPATVVIIGAGIAGLTCAQCLRHSFPNVRVIVVEAAETVGGRIKQSTDFVPGYSLDLGAEYVHGPGTILAGLVETQGWPVRHVFTWAMGDGGPATMPAPDSGVGMYYVGRERRLLPFDSRDPGFMHMLGVLQGLGDLPNPRKWMRDMSLRKYLEQRGVTEPWLEMAEAGYGNTLGDCMDRLSLAGAVNLERTWGRFDGEGDFRIQGSMGRVVAAMRRRLDVRTKWVAKSVTVRRDSAGGSASVIVRSATGEEIVADRVVVTVPLPVLRDGDISFSPSLPSDKLEAAQLAGVSGATKIVLKFSRRFWPKKLHGMILTDCIVPEIWFSASRTPTGALRRLAGQRLWHIDAATRARQRENHPAFRACALACARDGHTDMVPADVYIVSAFAMGKWARAIDAMSPDDVIARMLELLDSVFQKDVSASLADWQVQQAHREGAGAGMAAGVGAYSAGISAATAAAAAEDAAAPPSVPRSDEGPLWDPIAVRCVRCCHCRKASAAAAAAATAAAPCTCECRCGSDDEWEASEEGRPRDDLDGSNPRSFSCDHRPLPAPASSCCLGGRVHRWARDEPFVRCGYSTPGLHERPNTRQVLARSEYGALFFAGEHTNPRSHLTAHGAMGSGVRAAGEVARSLGFPASTFDANAGFGSFPRCARL